MGRVFSAAFGEGLILSNGDRRELHVLNRTAVELWNVCCGMEVGSPLSRCKAYLQNTYELDESEAEGHASTMLRKWMEADLLHENEAGSSIDEQNDWLSSPDRPLNPLQPGQIGFDVGSCPLALEVFDSSLRQSIQTHLCSLLGTEAKRHRHVIRISGKAERWLLSIDGSEVYCGTTADEAVVSVINQSLYLAFRAVDNLMVVHGAGVATQDGRGALLIAPSGSGKTTLAAALNVKGYALLNDDVVPVDLNGRVRSLSSPMCIKRGSWDVLARYRPDLKAIPEVLRFGHRVRLLAPVGEQPQNPSDCGVILFPKYAPDLSASYARITPNQTLQKLVAARPLLRMMDQDRLTALANWIESIPAYSFTFPTVESGVEIVDTLMGP